MPTHVDHLVIPELCDASTMSEPLSQRDLDRALQLGRSSHRWLDELLADRVETQSLRSDAPTRLAGWTVGHLLTHVARNADSHRRMIEGAGRGEELDQYEGGVDGRNAGIDAGADRAIDELVADVAAASAALEDAWAGTDWRGAGRRTIAGEATPIDRLPFLRVREVQLHTFDLGIGVELADLDPLYLRLEVDRLSMLWCARQPMGMAKLPRAALELPPTERLAWLTGRADVDGLAPAGIF